MSLLMECRKLRRTGYFPAFLAGGVLSAAFPVAYMMVKAEELTSLSGNPVELLMSANWQMMAMLNMLLSICGACVMYHTEFADNGMQKNVCASHTSGNDILLEICHRRASVCRGGSRDGGFDRLWAVLVSRTMRLIRLPYVRPRFSRLSSRCRRSRSCWSSPPPAGICGYLSESV